MGFSQVVEENGVKKLVPINTPASVTAQEAKLLALEAKQTADSALQKSGGEMTGQITFAGPSSQNNPLIKPSDIDKTNPVAGKTMLTAWQDKNGLFLGSSGIEFTQTMTVFRLGLINKPYEAESAANSTSLQLYYPKEGEPYAAGPNPRGLYNNDLATFKSMIDYGLKKLPHNSVIHIDAVNGSDTANLNNGRGLTADIPFKSLGAARSWVANNCGGSVITFQLHSDIEISSTLEIGCPNFSYIILSSDSTKRTINLTSSGYLSTGAGGVTLSNLIFNAQNSVRVLNCNAQSASASICMGAALEFNGSVSGNVLEATHGGRITLGGGFTKSGDITGKKYRLAYAGVLIGASKAPGTIDGTADASSTVA